MSFFDVARTNCRRRKTVISRVALATALLFADAAYAQTTAAPAAPAPAVMDPASTATGLQDIVVTARKRTENLRDVPIAVTALSGATLKSQNIARLTDLVTLVPNFTLSLGALQPLTYIRGFGSAGNTSFEQSVGKFVDNVSYGRDFDGRIPLFDIDNLEVLKGPQVLLYGNSTTAGAINITTRKPGRSFEADLTTSYEFENDEVLTQGGVTAPLTDWASLRVAGMFQDLAKGWIYNVGNGRNEPTIRNYAVRPTLRLTPIDGLEAVLKVEVDRIHDEGSVSQPIRQSTNPARQISDVTLDDTRNSNYDAAPFFTKEFTTVHAQVYQLDLHYKLPFGDLASTTAYRDVKAAGAQGTATDKLTVIPMTVQNYTQASQELRLSGKMGQLDYLVGVYYQSDINHATNFQSLNLGVYGLPTPMFGKVYDVDQYGHSYSGFGDLTYHITPKLSIEAGARYSVIRKLTNQASNPINFLPNLNFDTPRSAAVINHAFDAPFMQLFGIPHTFTGIRTAESHLQPQVVAQYEFAPRNMLYARYVKGDKAGGVDFAYLGSVARGANTSDAQFAPERAESFEAGLKGITSNSKLDYSISAFSTTFSNLQTSIFLGTSFLTANVGKARSRGVETQVAYTPVHGVRIDATAAYLDSNYLSYPNAACTVLQSQGTPPCAAPAGQNLSGAPTPYSSKYSGSIGLTFNQQVRNFNATLATSADYRSRYNSTVNDDPLGDQAGFVTVDARLEIAPLNSGWAFSIFGKDLTGYQYKEYSVATPLATGAFTTFLSRGRQIGLQIGLKY